MSSAHHVSFRSAIALVTGPRGSCHAFQPKQFHADTTFKFVGCNCAQPGHTAKPISRPLNAATSLSSTQHVALHFCHTSGHRTYGIVPRNPTEPTTTHHDLKLLDGSRRRSWGYGFVSFNTEAEAAFQIKEFMGRPIRVGIRKEPSWKRKKWNFLLSRNRLRCRF